MNGWSDPNLDLAGTPAPSGPGHPPGHAIRSQLFPDDGIGPVDRRPKCKKCDGPWVGGPLLLCAACHEIEADERQGTEDGE
jgi:hypothetical protein